MNSPVRPTVGQSDWFVRDRFGMFIHWGLYSLGARHEWLMHNEKMSVAEYEQRYLNHFDPDLYDPEIWADAAADAGMKYFVVTAKHHEGFCLWDSAATDFKATHAPCKRDLLTPMVSAFREKGLRAGLYYSLLDWHHPHCTIDKVNGPLRESPEIAKLNASKDMRIYQKYMRDQVRELITQYHPDVMWFDFSYPRADGFGKDHTDWDSAQLYKMIRELAPHMLIDDRLDLPEGWDFKTPEQAQPRHWVEANGQRVVWEACQTFSGSWGYHRDEADWRSTEELVRSLIDCVSKGGNLLLNVGPTGRGEIDARALDRLHGIGAWMKRNSRSIYGCTEAPGDFKAPSGTRFTYNPTTKRLYLHLFVWPYKHVHLEGFANRIEYAQLLHDASEVQQGVDEFTQQHLDLGGVTTLTLPKKRPDVAVPVVEIFLK